jgi:hypothetical protein
MTLLKSQWVSRPGGGSPDSVGSKRGPTSGLSLTPKRAVPAPVSGVGSQKESARAPPAQQGRKEVRPLTKEEKEKHCDEICDLMSVPYPKGGAPPIEPSSQDLERNEKQRLYRLVHTRLDTASVSAAEKLEHKQARAQVFDTLNKKIFKSAYPKRMKTVITCLHLQPGATEYISFLSNQPCKNLKLPQDFYFYNVKTNPDKFFGQHFSMYIFPTDRASGSGADKSAAPLTKRDLEDIFGCDCLVERVIVMSDTYLKTLKVFRDEKDWYYAEDHEFLKTHFAKTESRLRMSRLLRHLKCLRPDMASQLHNFLLLFMLKKVCEVDEKCINIWQEVVSSACLICSAG